MKKLKHSILIVSLFLKVKILNKGSYLLKKRFGGVVLTSADTKIVCKNTLDVRCELSFQSNLPMLRHKLF